ncbi:MAG: ATP-binding protein [Clostridia bacterium]
MKNDILKLFNVEKLGVLLSDEYSIKGFPYCKNCNTPRFADFIDEQGVRHVVRALCSCQIKKCKEEEELRLKEKRMKNFRERQKLSMIGERYLNASFKNSILTKNNTEVYKRCINYVKNADRVLSENIGLYIYGDNSSGKTHLTACMCNELISNGFTCVYTSLPKILSEIQKSFSINNGLGQADIINMLSNKQFVFIDDLGKEFLGKSTNKSQSSFAEKVLLEILNARDNNKLPTIFSSNYTIKYFAENFNLDKAIMERINVMATRVLKLDGDNFREKALIEKDKIAKELGI